MRRTQKYRATRSTSNTHAHTCSHSRAPAHTDTHTHTHRHTQTHTYTDAYTQTHTNVHTSLNALEQVRLGGEVIVDAVPLVFPAPARGARDARRKLAFVGLEQRIGHGLGARPKDGHNQAACGVGSDSGQQSEQRYGVARM